MESLNIYINPWFFALIVIVVVAFIIFAVIWSVRAHQRRITTGREELIGKVAVATTELNPRGTVLVEGEYWVAVATGGHVAPEQEVIITRIDGLKLTVTRKQ